MIDEYVRSSINRTLKIVDKLEPKTFEEQHDALLTRLDLSDDISTILVTSQTLSYSIRMTLR